MCDGAAHKVRAATSKWCIDPRTAGRMSECEYNVQLLWYLSTGGDRSDENSSLTDGDTPSTHAEDMLIKSPVPPFHAAILFPLFSSSAQYSARRPCACFLTPRSNPSIEARDRTTARIAGKTHTRLVPRLPMASRY